MKCPNCENALKNNPKFCPFCGNDLRELKRETPEVSVPEKKIIEPPKKTEIQKKKKTETQPIQSKRETKPNKKKNNMKWILLALVSLAIAAAIFLFFNNNNEAYKVAMENGIEAVSNEEYNDALAYFDDAAIAKNEDKEARLWAQNTVSLQQADIFYSDNQFDQALTKINEILEADLDAEDFSVLLEKTNELRKNIDKIVTEQELLAANLQEVQELFENTDTDEEIAEEINKKLDEILAHEEINQDYHADIKKRTEQLVSDVKTHEENLLEQKAKEAEEEKAKAEAEENEEAIKEQIRKYSAKDIEYARIILMDGYPTGSTIYVTERPAGVAVAGSYEETVKYPEPTVVLSGYYGADGMTVYSPIGGGYITVYPAPSHWHQEDQSPEGYREYAQQILDEAQKVYIDPGDPVELLEKLQTTEFIKGN